MSIKIEREEEVKDKLDELIDAEKLIKGIQKACALVERSAKQKAPKDTGELRRSITSKIDTINGEPVGVVFTPLEYAPYIEYGTGIFAEEEGRKDVPWHYQDDEGNWHSTSGIKPQSFMRAALDENRATIKRLLKEGITK